MLELCYSALLWHRLMGRNVLSTRFIGTTKKLRAYAHCSKNSVSRSTIHQLWFSNASRPSLWVQVSDDWTKVFYVFHALQPGITVLLINLDNTTAVQVNLLVQNAIPSTTSAVETSQQSWKINYLGRYKSEAVNEMVREEYHLTAKDGDLHSQTMLLNGEALTVNSSGSIPPLEPRKVDQSEPIIVAPFSIVFAQIATIQVPACR